MPTIVSMEEAEARPIERLPVKSGVSKLKVSHCNEMTCASAAKPTTSSNTRYASIMWMSATKTISGIRCGITTNRSRCKRDAPSMTADSSVSWSTVCNPA